MSGLKKLTNPIQKLVRDDVRHPQSVGHLDIQKIFNLTGVQLPSSEVLIYPGAIKHIKKRHPGVFEQYGELIPSIVTSPDYVGENPSEPGSVELYKVVNDHLLLAVKCDPTGYLFVSSLYTLNNGAYKIQKRLASGRIIPYV